MPFQLNVKSVEISNVTLINHLLSGFKKVNWIMERLKQQNVVLKTQSYCASFVRLFPYFGALDPDDYCKGAKSMLVKHCVFAV